MSSESILEEEEQAEMLYQAIEYESSEEPPMEQWSSLIIKIPEQNKKKLLYDEGLYDPGSGDVCTKCIPMSDSAILRHVYYNYPAVTDPGIKSALLNPEPSVIYPDDGQKLYLALCEEMSQAPIKKFYTGLLRDEIDLRYYCVDPKSVRAMCTALKYNEIVKVLNLTDNFLSEDACYHLGDMLRINSSLQELNLSGCRIKAEGTLRLFAGLSQNRALKTINLNRNNLGDAGVEYIAKAVLEGLDIQELYLSQNNIGAKAANALSEAFKKNCEFTILDFSWNNLISPETTYNLLTTLGESKVLQKLNLSWNSLSGVRVGTALKNVLKAPNIRYLNVSNNRLSGEAINSLIGMLPNAKKLVTLDLSYNPLSPNDALNILQKIKSAAVTVQNIIMENVFVNVQFLEVLEEVNIITARKNFLITYGGVITSFNEVGADPRELVLNRADYLAMKPKKRPIDIAQVVLQLLKDNFVLMPAKDFATAIRAAGAPLDDDLIDEIINIFAGPRTPKSKTIDIQLLADYVKRKWPERKLPPTPPPEPEPEPIPSKKKRNAKKRTK